MARRRLTPFARLLILCSVLLIGTYLGRGLYQLLEKGVRDSEGAGCDCRNGTGFGKMFDPEIGGIMIETEETLEQITVSIFEKLDEMRIERGYTNSLQILVLQSLDAFLKKKRKQVGPAWDLGAEEPERMPDISIADPFKNMGDDEKQPQPQPQPQDPLEYEATVLSSSLAKGVRPILHNRKPLMPVLKRDIFDPPPPATPLPPREEFKLRREMIDFRAKENVVSITFANFAFMDFVVNWVRHLTELGVDNILVGAMDMQVLEGLFRMGIPVFDLESNMPTDDPGWGSPVFHKMGREKVTLINVFLALGYEIFICDTDTVFVKNPLPYFARYPVADVFSSSDDLAGGATGDGLEPFDRAWASLNIGVLYFRPSAAAIKMAREWSEQLAADDSVWDQNAFNQIMRNSGHMGPNTPDSTNLFYAFDGNLKLGILPVSIFCSGHTFFVQRKAEKMKMEVYAVHATFQFAGTEGKRHRFREGQLFYDPPAYYSVQGGLLSFSPNIPKDILYAKPPSLLTHFNLVNYQLKVLRNAFAIATILNRTLVMPPLYCHYDRVWFQHPGILDGTDTSQPFLCPMDHIFEVNLVLKEWDVAEFGPHIPIREYSFLENPNTPNQMKEDRLEVDTCQEEDRETCPGQRTGDGKTQLPKHASQAMMEKVLKSESAKVIHFNDMLASFGQWDDKVREEKFRWRISHYLGIWCCGPGSPGHIWYDFFWDKKDGWTPKPPRNWLEDHPQLAAKGSNP